MYHVLVPVDENTNRAHNQAKYVARLAETAADVEATVLYVASSDEVDDGGERTFDAIPSAVAAAEHLETEGVRVERSVSSGRVARSILDAAADLDPGEIVVGGRKRSAVAKVLLGSTALDVILSAEHPVTVTGDDVGAGADRRRVLVAVDQDRDRALSQARYVAGLPGAPDDVAATVLVVFRHQDYAGAPPHEFEEIQAAVDAADHLVDAGIEVERVGIGGEIASKILDRAEAADVDDIVMGGRKRSGVQKVLLGSTTHDVVLSTERPVTITG